MITLRFRTVALTKRYPLAISRGTQAGSENLFVTAADGVHEGLGAMAPAIGSEWTAGSGREQLAAFAARFRKPIVIVPAEEALAMRIGSFREANVSDVVLSNPGRGTVTIVMNPFRR